MHAELTQSGHRCEQWALGLLEDGKFKSCPDTVIAYYKAPVAMAAIGQPAAGAQLMQHISKTFFKNGDFHALPGDPGNGPGRTYRNAWLTWGAHVLGAHELSVPALERLERNLHPEFFGAPDDDEVPFDERQYLVGNTASVANAFLACGRLDAAIRAGRFIKTVFDEQDADAAKVLMARGVDGKLPDAASYTRPALRLSAVFDTRAPDQIYWIFGFSIRVFARLYRATGDRGWLDTAEKLRCWLERSNASLYAHVTNGKLAWGASEMYGVTADEKWGELARRITQWVISQQGDDGVWVRRPQFASSADQPLPISLDTSIERMFYMTDMQRALSMPRA